MPRADNGRARGRTNGSCPGRGTETGRHAIVAAWPDGRSAGPSAIPATVSSSWNRPAVIAGTIAAVWLILAGL